jgi:hypothetical protein
MQVLYGIFLLKKASCRRAQARRQASRSRALKVMPGKTRRQAGISLKVKEYAMSLDMGLQ